MIRPSTQLSHFRNKSTLEHFNKRPKSQAFTIKKRSKSLPLTINEKAPTKKYRPRQTNFLSFRDQERSARTIENLHQDQDFFYKNLHNQRLWKWEFPMDYCELKKSPTTRPCKVNLSVLERFKSYMEKRVGKRVPLAVQQILDQTVEMRY